MIRTTTFLFLVLTVPAAVACSKKASSPPTAPAATRPAGSARAAAAPAAPAEAPEPPAILASQKIARIVGCFNTFTEDMHEVRDKYLGEVDANRGPRRPSDVVAGIVWRMSRMYNPDSDGGCRAAARALATTAPATPAFDTAVVAWAAGLERLLRANGDAHAYFDRHDYEDDHAARVMPLHRELIASFEEYFAAEDALGHAMDDIQAAATDARLAVLANDPARRVEFLLERTRGCTARIGGAISDLELAEGRGARVFASADPAAFFASIEACERFTNEMAAAPGIAGVSRFQGVVSRAQAFMTQAVVFGRVVRDRQTFRSENDASYAKQRPILIYNQLIDSYNSLG